jgi:hypothetical protein
MPATAEVLCTGCDTRVIVFPSTLYGLVPADTGEAFPRGAGEDRDRGGSAIRGWRCPMCDSSSIVPVIDLN